MSRNKPYNAGDPLDVENAQADVDLEVRQELTDVRAILLTPEGKRFFRRMFGFGHIENPCFTGNSNTFYNLGLREFALKYWKLAKKADPDSFAAIILSMESDNG